MAFASFLHIGPKKKKKIFFMLLTFILFIKKKHKIYVNSVKNFLYLVYSKKSRLPQPRAADGNIV